MVSARATRRRGSTLSMVLMFGVLFGALALVTATVAQGGRKAASADRASADLSYRCEGAAEALRLELTNQWESTGLMPAQWFAQQLRAAGATTPAPPRADMTAVPGLPGFAGGYPRSYAAFPEVVAWVDQVGQPGQNFIDIVAATTSAVGATQADQRAPQSVRIRINFGNNPIFDLAMLTQTTNCMFCHLRVNGDVGSVGFFRPGWGRESYINADGNLVTNGHNSGNDSQVVGRVYVGPPSAAEVAGGLADYVTNDGATWTDGAGTTQKSLNGARVLAPDPNDVHNSQTSLADNVAGVIEANYTGPKLPDDSNGDGTADFPAIDTAVAELQSTGKLGVGGSASAITVNGTPTTAGSYGAWKVPLGKDLATDLTPVAPTDFNYTNAEGGTSSVLDGNLILIGTYDNPINLDGDVFVKGDVVIKGYVQGRGGIYAGRNVYVAGDIIYKDLPANWPLKDDAQAVSAVANSPNASELRLAARSNIVVGDWTYQTERNADGKENDILPQRDRQGEMFMQDQFSLGSVRYYEADHQGSVVSSELTPIASSYVDADGKTVPITVYQNDKGEVVPTDRVTKVDSNTRPEYPSGVSTNYNLYPERYDAALAPGTVVRENSGNTVASGTFDPWMKQSEFREILGTQEIENAVARTGGAFSNDATKSFEFGNDEFAGSQFDGTNAPSMGSGKHHFEAKLNPDGTYADQGRLIRNDGRIVDVGKHTWPTQVQHIDAFLYANKRIGGTSRYALTINGGMASSAIGVLAVYDYEGNYLPSSNMTTTSDSNAFLAGHRTWMNQNETDLVRTYTDPADPNVRSDPLRRFILNYDYRLRNGGYGYNLIEGGAGERLFFSRGHKVTTP